MQVIVNINADRQYLIFLYIYVDIVILMNVLLMFAVHNVYLQPNNNTF